MVHHSRKVLVVSKRIAQVQRQDGCFSPEKIIITLFDQKMNQSLTSHAIVGEAFAKLVDNDEKHRNRVLDFL